MTILKSILLSDSSPHHIHGLDLNGGADIAFDFEDLDTKFLGHDPTRWEAGDIVTVRVDEQTRQIELRIVTSHHQILRLCEFHIYDIADASRAAPTRHIYLQGRATTGAVFILPMLGYTAWNMPWDFAALAARMEQAEDRQPTGLTHDLVTQHICDSDELKRHVEIYNDIFYPGTQAAGTLFDHAKALDITCFSGRQNGTQRAAMMVAAFIKRDKTGMVGYKDYPHVKRGTAFSPPYFVVDGERAFLRTGNACDTGDVIH